jgi:hypothetical protein
MNCNCQELPSLVSLHEFKAFLTYKSLLETRDWKEIFQCLDCGQKWIVDIPDKLQVRRAVRGDNTDEVESRMRDLIKNRIVNRRGGLEAEDCIWDKCRNKRVKGFSMCVDHLYDAGHRG